MVPEKLAPFSDTKTPYSPMKGSLGKFVPVPLTLVVLLSHGAAFGQSLDSALAYFPMAVGDTWEYAAYWGMTAANQFEGYFFMSITVDTVMPNGKHYFVLRNGSGLYGLFTEPAYLRLDSSTANVRSYNSGLGQESTWDSLLARAGNLAHYGTLFIRSDTIMGTPTVTRTYHGIYDQFSISYGFGVTSEASITEYQEEYAYKIVYAKIGGVEYGTLMGAAESMQNVPAQFKLFQNYPNPFNPSTTIRYTLPSRSHVTLTVDNALGQLVTKLVSGIEEAGYYEVEFDGANLSSGVYFYRLQAGSFVRTLKMLVVK